MKKKNVLNHTESEFWNGISDSYSWLKYLFIGMGIIALSLNVFL